MTVADDDVPEAVAVTAGPPFAAGALPLDREAATAPSDDVKPLVKSVSDWLLGELELLLQPAIRTSPIAGANIQNDDFQKSTTNLQTKG